jgi:glycogen synthase
MWQDKKEWNALVRRAMLCDYGWDKPSKLYLEMYQEALDL